MISSSPGAQAVGAKAPSQSSAPIAQKDGKEAAPPVHEAKRSRPNVQSPGEMLKEQRKEDMRKSLEHPAAPIAVSTAPSQDKKSRGESKKRKYVFQTKPSMTVIITYIPNFITNWFKFNRLLILQARISCGGRGKCEMPYLKT
jgi:hypothetical protein